MRSRLFIGLLLHALLSCAQNEALDLEQFAERLFQLQHENVAYEDIYESLLLFYSNKLDLNSAEPHELESLYILNIGQINQFFSYRDEFGDLISINELQAIPLFDVLTIRSLLPFVTIKSRSNDPRPLLKRMQSEENNFLLLRYSQRLERQTGYTAAVPLDTLFSLDERNTIQDTVTIAPVRYLGSAAKVYGRFRTSHKDDFSLGFTFEKDAGEAFAINDDQTGFDFYSYHLLLEHTLGLEKIVLGDFQLQTGQGVLFGAGFNTGKGAETVNTTKRSTLGLRPYTAALESGFFRGIGLTKQLGDLEITAFYSNARRDGNIQVDTTSLKLPDMSSAVILEEEFTNSITTSGLHRTPQEIKRRRSIKENSIGGFVSYAPSRNLTIGLSGIATKYSIPIRKTPNNYNLYEFNGTQNQVTSVFSTYSWQNVCLFGEAGRSSSGGTGSVGGVVASLSHTIDFAMVIRKYDRHFHSFYGNAFAEGSRNINENGVYWGLTIRPKRRHQLNLYYDRYRFPWLKFRTEAPSSGDEWLVRYSVTPSRNVSLLSQARKQTRQLTRPNGNLNELVDQTKYNFLFAIDLSVATWLTLKTRIQSSLQHLAVAQTKGFAIVQDINFVFWKIKVHTRMALFDTDNFDNAQYVYENDVLYAFSIPAYSGSGIRNYLMIRYDVIRRLTLYARYARTTFPNSNNHSQTLGSSLEESKGNTSSELKLMLRIKF